jgi:tetratricopeptide (TPR) repeat protein
MKGNRDRDVVLDDKCLYAFGWAFQECGHYEQAGRMYKRIVENARNAYGSGQENIGLDATIGLGIVYKVQGKWVEAEKMYERALAGYEKALGVDHPSTLHTVNNLGILYKIKGN